MNEYAKKYVCIKKDKEFRFLFKKGDSIVTDAFVCYARESKTVSYTHLTLPTNSRV